jgi:hypothetical protein
MEPLTIFAMAIALFGAIHLTFTAVNHLDKGIFNSGNQKQKREDWYCFFKTSDLLGTDREKIERINERPSKTEAEELEQRRRIQASRPRLHV